MSRPKRFLLIFGFELSLFAAALAGAHFTSTPILADFSFSLTGLIYATAAAAVGFYFFQRAYRSEAAPLRNIRHFLEESARPLFAGMGPLELLLLGTAAGLGEEALFRGWLQPWLASHWGTALSVAATSAAFGLAHPMTLGYALYAAAIGLALGLLGLQTGGWFAPAFAHGLYDFLALSWYLARKT